MPTERLYHDDAYLTEFRARVVECGADPRDIYLDRTAFYPTSGGQPHDTGEIASVKVIDVVDEGDRVRHRLERPVEAAEVTGKIEWERRFDHMQQHTGQHILSAAFVELFGIQTASFHLGAGVSTIDLDAGSLSPEQLREAEARANRIVFENRPVRVSYEEAGEAAGLRKQVDREGKLRIVSIEGYDRSACGGTHVRATGEVGVILLRRTERIRKRVRLEFLCGGRAVRRARADYEALDACARVFSARLDETPELVAALQRKFVESEKAGKRLGRELAEMRGRELYRETEPGPGGIRYAVRRIERGGLSEEVRAEALSFRSLPNAVFLAVSEDPPGVLLAASEDSGIHAGNLLREAVSRAGGRGGGNARLAQGSLPSAESAAEVERCLAEQVLGMRDSGASAG